MLTFQFVEEENGLRVDSTGPSAFAEVVRGRVQGREEEGGAAEFESAGSPTGSREFDELISLLDRNKSFYVEIDCLFNHTGN